MEAVTGRSGPESLGPTVSSGGKQQIVPPAGTRFGSQMWTPWHGSHMLASYRPWLLQHVSGGTCKSYMPNRGLSAPPRPLARSPTLLGARSTPPKLALPPHALKNKGCSFGILMGAWVSLDRPKVPGRVLNQLMGAHSCMVLQCSYSHAAPPSNPGGRPPLARAPGLKLMST
jgi:hypothetical protein